MSVKLTLAATLLAGALVSTLAAAQDQTPTAPVAAPSTSDQTVHQMPAGPGTDLASHCNQTDSSGLARFYPSHARDNDIEGQAMLECALDSEDRLETCWVLSETPVNERFGEAALRLACFARARGRDTHTSFQINGDTRPHVTFALNFRLSG